jgi:glycosyltransferase involved in cell wall biosynthesis
VTEPVSLEPFVDSGHTIASLPVAKDDITVVVPVKNEESAISLVLDELFQEGYSNVLVVDGYSSDDTLRVLGEKEGVQFISQHGRGKTGAVKTAIENVTTPYLLVIDGDYTYPAKDIERLLNHGVSYGEVIGVRDRSNMPKVHRFGNWVVTSAFNLLFGTGLSDVCSGMYLLKTKVAKELELNSGGFDSEVEIASQAVVVSSVTDVPIGYRKRVGKGKLSARYGLNILSAVLRLAWKFNPVLLFSAIASLSMIPALVVLGWVVLDQLSFGVWHSGLALVGVLLLLFASQAFAVATMSALSKRMEQRIIRKISKSASA